MKTVIHKLDDVLSAIEKGFVVCLFSALVGLIVFNIVTRNLFRVSFQQSVEMAPTFVLWLALLGATLALKNSRHIRLELLLRFCPPPVRRIADAVTGLFGAAVMGILLYTSIGFVENEVAIFGRGAWLSVIFPLFFALSGFRYLAQVIIGKSSENRTSKGSPSPRHDSMAV